MLLAVFAGFLGISWICHYFPSLLHRPKKRRTKPIVHISHRGGCGEGYENTLSTFRRAVKIAGTSMLELDCQLSKDGVVVVSHDRRIQRTTGQDLDIMDLCCKELPLIQKEVPLDFEIGVYKPLNENDEDESARQFATLESVFEEFPSTAINIDIKTHDEALVRKVNELVKSYDRESITIWGSFRQCTTDLCYKTNPNVGLFCSLERVIKILILHYTGFLPFVPLTETHYEIPMPSIFLRLGFCGQEPTTFQSFVIRLADTILLRPSLIAHLQKRGIPTFIWVLNREEDFERAYKLGATGVMTDYPTLLREYLKRNPQYASDS